MKRRAAVITKDSRIVSRWVKPKDLETRGGHKWITIEGQRYLWAGPWYEFTYRAVRTFGAIRHVGLQRIYLEGNPMPFRLAEDERMALLQGTAKALADTLDSDAPERLMRPRRVDLILIVLVALMTLAVGMVIGTRL